MKVYVLTLVLLFTGASSAYRIPENFEVESEMNSQSDDPLIDPLAMDEMNEIPDLEEGDIRLSEEMKNDLKNNVPSKRNAQRNRHYLWSGRIIPYEIDSPLTDKTTEIMAAINEFHQKTCLQFVPKASHQHWIKFVLQTGCWSFVGRQFSTDGAQEVSLGTGCYNLNTIVHEIMHALGFWHEQSRPDRDKYVEIFWENIIKDKESNFVRHGSEVVDTLGVVYDYNSILHYKPTAFSANGRFTLTSIGDPQNTKNVGPGNTLSPLDIIKVDRLYCKDPSSLGLETGGPFPDAGFTASSFKDFFGFYNPRNGRLESASAWCANVNDVSSQYLEVDFGSATAVRTLATQGSALYAEWVKKYTIKYSNDRSAWQTYSENGAEKVFSGNTDQSTIVKNKLPTAINARYIRFYPKEVQVWPCMRIGLYGEDPVNKLSPWSNWGPCERSQCKKSRQRFCTSYNIAADCPTANSHGVITETIDCTNAECTAPIDGHWNKWSSWSSCSKTCDLGTRTRTRTCDDPAPSFGGKTCESNNTMAKSCRDKFCGMGSNGCSFTSDTCTWTQDPSANIQWSRGTGPTPSKNTGPSGDHTSPDGFGYYIYLEASGVAVGAKAILRSAEQPAASGQMCLSFYYHMLGTYMGTLNVKLESNGAQQVLTTLAGSSGDQWLSKKLTFTSANNYVLLFEGVRGSSWSSDMAIDDITLVSGACSSR